MEKFFESHFLKEFDRFQDSDDDQRVEDISLDAVLQLEGPQDYPITFSHLGVLFLLSRDKNGSISRDEMVHFSKLCAHLHTNVKNRSLDEILRVYGIAQLWKHTVPEIRDWLLQLLLENDEIAGVPEEAYVAARGLEFLCLDTVKTMFDLFRVPQSFGVDFQDFLDLLQRTAMEKGIITAEDERLDEIVPKAVVQTFLDTFLTGMFGMLESLGMEKVEEFTSDDEEMSGSEDENDEESDVQSEPSFSRKEEEGEKNEDTRLREESGEETAKEEETIRPTES